MKLSNYEIIGIGVAILAMAGALWLTEVENNFLSVGDGSAAEQEAAGAVTVADGGSQAAALRSAIMEAGGGDAQLERLIIDDVVVGAGEEVEEGDTVTVHYIGTLPNGQEFDSSRRRGEPFTFTVGDGRVIAGWEEGVLGMQEGGQRILVIPPELAYGEDGFGPIPGDATLVFAIELLSIE